MKQAQWIILGISVVLLGLLACSKMDDTYTKFIEEGELVYPSPPDSLQVHPGKNRIGFTWLLGDPTVSEVRIFWNNRKDSFALPVQSNGTVDTITATLTDMKEGTYTFFLYSYDKKGNPSIEVSAVGVVYGEQYQESLLTRLPRSAQLGYDTLNISWANPVNEAAQGTRIYYTDTTGKKRDTLIKPAQEAIHIPDYDFTASKGQFHYATLYLPDTLAIDTFYTPRDSMTVVKMKVIADGHQYTAVFADDGLNPHYLFFLGYPRGRDQQMVWKYDLSGDSLLSGYPKLATKVFAVPYAEIHPVRRVSWLSAGACFFNNGQYCTYSFQTGQFSALHSVTDLSIQKWHPKFPEKIDCGYYMPGRNANYMFADTYYDKMKSNGKWYKGYPKVLGTKGAFPEMPEAFINDGFTGAVFNATDNYTWFFSGDSFVKWSFNTKGVEGEVRKIKDYFKGL